MNDIYFSHDGGRRPPTAHTQTMRHICYLLLLLIVQFTGKAQSALTPEQWQRDIELLRTGLPTRVPSLFSGKYTQKEFDADLSALAQKTKGRPDLEVALELQTIVAKAGHAYARLDLSSLLQKDKIIPIGLGTFSDGVYMSGTVKRFERALRCKILSINNQDIEVVYQKLARFVSQDNEQTLRRDGLQWLRFPAAFRLAGISQSDTLNLVIQNPRGGHDVVSVFPLDPQRNQRDMTPSIVEPRSPDLRWRQELSLWDLQWLPQDSVVYFQYNGCIGRESAAAHGETEMAEKLPPFQPIADSIAHLMAQHPNARFFFDIRINNGGRTDDGFALADRLAAMPEVNQKGRLYVAIGWFTGLEAGQVAQYFRQKTKAVLLGEPTAERVGRSNPVGSFGLPSSGISVTYPAANKPQDKSNLSILQPDIQIQRSFEDFRLGRDPVLDWVRRGGKQ